MALNGGGRKYEVDLQINTTHPEGRTRFSPMWLDLGVGGCMGVRSIGMYMTSRLIDFC